ncbi:MAG: PilZ domain-containing protein, partial [Candidatus Sulfotelmatobacter sp.]
EVFSERLAGQVCSVFVTFPQEHGRSIENEERWTSFSMDSPDGTGSAMNSRRFPRYEFDAAVDITAFGMKNERVIRGRSLNISEAGMGAVFVGELPAGTAVTLKFSVPVVSNLLRVDAIVRSRSDHRSGFEFVELNPAQREIVSKTCRTLALLQ